MWGLKAHKVVLHVRCVKWVMWQVTVGSVHETGDMAGCRSFCA